MIFVMAAQTKRNSCRRVRPYCLMGVPIDHATFGVVCRIGAASGATYLAVTSLVMCKFLREMQHQSP